MENIIVYIRNVTVLFITLLISLTSFAQIKTHSVESVLGNWLCIKHDYRGYQNYTIKQAEKIRKSVLHINKNTFHFENVSFIDQCVFYKWQIKPYDVNLPIQNLRTLYTDQELRDMLLLEPVDNIGNSACYNNCISVLNKDTLITICGGYTFYWIKAQRIMRYSKKR